MDGFEFTDTNKMAEEEIKNNYIAWVCPKAEFEVKEIRGKGCGFVSSTFSDFIKVYEEKDFSNKQIIKLTAFGEISSAYSIKDEMEVCLKVIHTEHMKFDYKINNSKDYRIDLNNEILILTLFADEKNSVNYYGCYDKDKLRVIVMEKCDSNLKDFIDERKKSLSTEEIKANFVNINKILKTIQEKLIIHRDLKPENFLIKYTNQEKTEYIIKLPDYGISRFKSKKTTKFSGIKGTEDYIAPEILLGKVQKYDSEVDIFSLGLILYECSHNLKNPFGPVIEECYIIYKMNYEKDDYNIEFDESIKNEDFKDLIRKMLKINPANRISWKDYFDHPFFK